MRISTIIIFLFYLINIHATEFGTHWMCYPEPDDSSQIWFRQTFHSNQKPKIGKIALASTGRCQLYVNGRRVGREVYTSNIENDSMCIIERNYDITNVLRKDSNTIAIWYSPGTKSNTDKQISLYYYGIDAKGNRFSHPLNENWYCRISPGITGKNNSESYRSIGYFPRWKYNTVSLLGWEHPIESSDTTLYSLRSEITPITKQKITHIYYPEQICKEENQYRCHFTKPFSGWIRLTIRDAKVGQIVNIGNYTYICNGSMDEQACRRFTKEYQQDVIISGDERFKKLSIQNIEGLEIEEQTEDFFTY